MNLSGEKADSILIFLRSALTSILVVLMALSLNSLSATRAAAQEAPIIQLAGTGPVPSHVPSGYMEMRCSVVEALDAIDTYSLDCSLRALSASNYREYFLDCYCYSLRLELPEWEECAREKKWFRFRILEVELLCKGR